MKLTWRERVTQVLLAALKRLNPRYDRCLAERLRRLAMEYDPDKPDDPSQD